MASAGENAAVSCLDCWFFRPAFQRGEGTNREAGLRAQASEGFAGFCHRYPPPEQDDDGNLPITVHGGSWCGEFRPEVENPQAHPAPTAIEVLRSLSSAEIRQRLAELDGEAKALRTLLRAAARAERGRQVKGKR